MDKFNRDYHVILSKKECITMYNMIFSKSKDEVSYSKYLNLISRSDSGSAANMYLENAINEHLRVTSQDSISYSINLFDNKEKLIKTIKYNNMNYSDKLLKWIEDQHITTIYEIYIKSCNNECLKILSNLNIKNNERINPKDYKFILAGEKKSSSNTRLENNQKLIELENILKDNKLGQQTINEFLQIYLKNRLGPFYYSFTNKHFEKDMQDKASIQIPEISKNIKISDEDRENILKQANNILNFDKNIDTFLDHLLNKAKIHKCLDLDDFQMLKDEIADCSKEFLQYEQDCQYDDLELQEYISDNLNKIGLPKKFWHMYEDIFSAKELECLIDNTHTFLRMHLCTNIISKMPNKLKYTNIINESGEKVSFYNRFDNIDFNIPQLKFIYFNIDKFDDDVLYKLFRNRSDDHIIQVVDNLMYIKESNGQSISDKNSLFLADFCYNYIMLNNEKDKIDQNMLNQFEYKIAAPEVFERMEKLLDSLKL